MLTSKKATKIRQKSLNKSSEKLHSFWLEVTVSAMKGYDCCYFASPENFLTEHDLSKIKQKGFVVVYDSSMQAYLINWD